MIVRHDSVTQIDFGGLRILDYTAGEETASSFAVITVPPGGGHPESWSKRSDKYYYVASGTIEFTVEDDVHMLSTADLCIITKGEHFSYRNPGVDPAQIHLVHTPSLDLDSEVFVHKT